MCNNNYRPTGSYSPSYNSAPYNYNAPAISNASDPNLYVQRNANGFPVQVDPNEATSPLSVQPNGPGTPLVGAPLMESEMNISAQSELPETLTHYEYIPGFMRAHIGALMRVEFLIGDNTTDRVGRLREVGASYIVLESLDGVSRLMCDLYSIKFATIIEQATPQFQAESRLQSEAAFL